MPQNFITVITPIYNEEKNILNCINTLVNQTSQNFNVIFIDDGSDDMSVAILKTALENKVQFSYEIITQKNQGAAKARETGINAATTDYILILDCDDRISENTIEKHIETIHELSPDIILPFAKIQNNTNEYDNFNYFDDKQSHQGITCLLNSLGGWQVHGWMCARRDIFIKSYNTYKRYNPTNINYINNDEVIVRLNFFYAKNVQKNDAIYYYENNTESTTKKINQNRYLMCKNAIILCNIFKNENHIIVNKTYKELINVLWGTVKYANRNYHQLSNIEDWNTTISQVFDFIKKNNVKHTLSLKGKFRLIRARRSFIKFQKTISKQH